MPAPFVITALANATERTLIATAIARLERACAGGFPIPLSLQFRPPIQTGGNATGLELVEGLTGNLVVLSLAAELDEAVSDRTVEQWTQGWVAVCEAIEKQTNGVLFLCTVFRHVSESAGKQRASSLRDRIRRLNLAVVETSRITGAFVIDVDRSFASVGARRLQTDYRLEGPIAFDYGAWVIADTILRGAPDELFGTLDRDAIGARVQSESPRVLGSDDHPTLPGLSRAMDVAARPGRRRPSGNRASTPAPDRPGA